MAIVTHLPLTPDALGPARPGREVGLEELRELLRAGPVQFVVANVGHALEWVPIA